MLKSECTFSVCFLVIGHVALDASRGHVKGNLPEGLCAPLQHLGNGRPSKVSGQVGHPLQHPTKAPPGRTSLVAPPQTQRPQESQWRQLRAPNQVGCRAVSNHRCCQPLQCTAFHPDTTQPLEAGFASIRAPPERCLWQRNPMLDNPSNATRSAPHSSRMASNAVKRPGGVVGFVSSLPGP